MDHQHKLRLELVGLFSGLFYSLDTFTVDNKSRMVAFTYACTTPGREGRSVILFEFSWKDLHFPKFWRGGQGPFQTFLKIHQFWIVRLLSGKLVPTNGFGMDSAKTVLTPSLILIFHRGTELVFFSNSLKIERVVSVRHSQTQPAWAANQWISAEQTATFGTENW